MMRCGQCNQQNPDEAQFCHQCGAKLAEATAAAKTTSEAPTAWSVQDDETQWRQFIGPNADHYLTVFKKFSSNGRPKFALSWNWPAFLYISFLWFLYRKMYLHAFVYAVGPMISTYLTGDFSAGIVWSIMAGATANYLYYWHCREHIGEIKKADRMDRAAQETALKESGGVQPYVIWVGVVFYIIFLATLVKMIQEGPPDLDKSHGNLRCVIDEGCKLGIDEANDTSTMDGAAATLAHGTVRGPTGAAGAAELSRLTQAAVDRSRGSLSGRAGGDHELNAVS